MRAKSSLGMLLSGQEALMRLFALSRKEGKSDNADDTPP